MWINLCKMSVSVVLTKLRANNAILINPTRYYISETDAAINGKFKEQSANKRETRSEF